MSKRCKTSLQVPTTFISNVTKQNITCCEYVNDFSAKATMSKKARVVAEEISVMGCDRCENSLPTKTYNKPDSTYSLGTMSSARTKCRKYFVQSSNCDHPQKKHHVSCGNSTIDRKDRLQCKIRITNFVCRRELLPTSIQTVSIALLMALIFLVNLNGK